MLGDALNGATTARRASSHHHQHTQFIIARYILFYYIYHRARSFMIITAVINIHNAIRVLFSISTCAISFISIGL